MSEQLFSSTTVPARIWDTQQLQLHGTRVTEHLQFIQALLDLQTCKNLQEICKFSTVSKVSCLVWDRDDSFPLASLSFCWTEGGDPSLESSEPVHPCRAQSVCKRAGIWSSCKHISSILLAVWGPPHSRDARSNHRYISYQKQSIVAFILTFCSGKS